MTHVRLGNIVALVIAMLIVPSWPVVAALALAVALDVALRVAETRAADAALYRASQSAEHAAQRAHETATATRIDHEALATIATLKDEVTALRKEQERLGRFVNSHETTLANSRTGPVRMGA